MSSPSALSHHNMPAELSANVGVLPTDVLYEVLLHLPANVLCRFRLVCRSWRSLTSNPDFAQAHTSRHPLLASIRHNLRYSEVHLVDLNGNIVKRLPIAQHPIYDLNTQLDMLSVSTVHGDVSYVVNPVSGEVTTLPNGAHFSDVAFCEASSQSVLGKIPNYPLCTESSPSLLEHIPSTGEYKVLRTNSYYATHNGGDRTIRTCNVITLSSERWRARPCPPIQTPPTGKDRVVIDGVAYFFLSELYDDNNFNGEPDSIGSFDLAAEQWRPLILRGPLNSHLATADNKLKFNRDYKEDNLQLVVMNRCLGIVHHKKRDCSMDLWFLVDMDIHKRLWSKRYSIRCESHAHMHPYPLHLLSDGRILVWGAEQERVLKVYDPITRVWANLASMEQYGLVRMHIGSLLCSGLQSC
ncbi:unnamed protein product [Urochloa decumbens]|uniref:F-box domain-containing protein n=1 Tax=Urochloa decumbens TaxID=240449 RepID=A0ABC9G8L7_9POAL